MVGYVFTFGVDGFGADVAPAHTEGVYLDYDAAFKHLCKLNESAIKNDEHTFYEDGYGEDHYPESDEAMAKAQENDDLDAIAAELEKHKITSVSEICKRIMQYEIPPFGMYSMEEIEIIDGK